MLAGMELDLFTPLAGGPLSAGQIADAVGVQATKLRPLLYALVVAELLMVEDGLFSNTIEAGRYLVRGQAYTEQEYRDWLAEAGLVDIERVVLASEVSIVTARKPA
jgi:hypothetical protein